VLVESTTVSRLGVRAADLHISLATDARDAAGRVTTDMVDLLQPVRFSDSMRADYVDVRARISGGFPMSQIGMVEALTAGARHHSAVRAAVT